MSDWDGYILEDYKFQFEPGSVVLDVGCGEGDQMRQIITEGSSVFGLDLDVAALVRCRQLELEVLCASGEQLPFKDASFDGILCKVVIPYTREDQVVAEFARLLKPGGKCYLIGHGAGYYLKYLLLATSWKYRFHGLRVLANTWVWSNTRRRLPGFLGDTLYQSRRRLAKYYAANGLSIFRDTPSKNFLGVPVFTYQLIEKRLQHK